MDVDGWLVIGTKLNTDQLKQDLKDEQKMLQQYEKENERLEKVKVKIELDLQEYEQQKALIQQTTDEMLKSAQTTEQVNETLKLEDIQLQELNQKYAQQFEELEQVNNKIRENEQNLVLVNKRLDDTNSKLQASKGMTTFKKAIDNVGKSVDRASSKITHMMLAIFGIRSLYSFFQRSMSTLSQYDDELATKLEYLRYVLASSIKPIVENIVDLAYRLLGYINLISKAWFGIDLFANASEEEFQKMNNSAKELKKTLMGFDEMNIIQDNGKTSGLSGMGELIGGLNDQLNPQQTQMPKWLTWIMEHPMEIGGGLLSLGVGGLIGKLFGLNPLQIAGIVLAGYGVTETIGSLTKYITDPSWKNFGGTLTGIGDTMTGLGLATGNWELVLIGLITRVFGMFVSNWEKIKEKLEEGIKWLKSLSPKIHSMFGDTIGGVYDIFMDGLGNMLGGLETELKSMKHVLDGFMDIFHGLITGNVKEIASGVQLIIFSMFERIWARVGPWLKTIRDLAIKYIINPLISGIRQLPNIFKGPINLIIGFINLIIRGLNKIHIELPDWDILGKLAGKKWGFNISQIEKLERGGIVNLPTKGVPVGNAITGERGMEGVIPLTNEQQMELLGEAIGRHISIHNVNPIYLNGRLLDRKMNEVRAEKDFAFNR